MMYGIWNSVEKRFVFGVSEPTSNAAWKSFKKKVPQAIWRKWRYDVKPIPEGFRNAKNPRYKKER